MYQPRQTAVSRYLDVRGLRYHLSTWPGTGRPIVLLHGFMDCGSSFQFLVDALRLGRPVLAPDWRGFGRSAWATGGYWFPDYFADLDALLAVLSPDEAVDLVGHSMGGNIALVYAGLRPERVRRVVALEGFGLPGAEPSLAPGRYREWLAQLRQPETATVFPGFDVLAQVLRKRNPRLDAARAEFVAREWAEPLADGRVRLRFDPAHRRVNPVLYRREETEACWREVRAPLAYVIGGESELVARLQGAAEPDAMRRHLPQLEPHVVAGAGHMLHHDRPEAVAHLVEGFLDRGPL
jgi:Predicted hydrolases or acyltransferases (alpha/beta hydrolase superfamily)